MTRESRVRIPSGPQELLAPYQDRPRGGPSCAPPESKSARLNALQVGCSCLVSDTDAYARQRGICPPLYVTMSRSTSARGSGAPRGSPCSSE
jgi:hypothetical protein